MVIDENTVFNLWDTNGRRSDVLNALDQYLSILDDLQNDDPSWTWENYPNSLSQFNFYKEAIERSPDIFKKHPIYDNFVDILGNDYKKFAERDSKWISSIFDRSLFDSHDSMRDTLDKAIEARARHYTSNLVRFGFTDAQRRITPAGNSFLKSTIQKDSIEALLPLGTENLLILRQLMKLRIYSKPDNNNIMCFYSPFFMAIHLLLGNDVIDSSDFSSIIQGLNPYIKEEDKEKIKGCKPINIENIFLNKITSSQIPTCFSQKEKVEQSSFQEWIKNRKSGKTEECYYKFYSSLYEFVSENTEEKYEALRNVYHSNKDKIKKAFTLGKNVFDFGTNEVSTMITFIVKNADNLFLKKDNFNSTFYIEYLKSKYIDIIKEYSDTTMRMFGSTGLFRFKNGIPSLVYKDLFSIIFGKIDIGSKIFGVSTNDEYLAYEVNEKSVFGSSCSFHDILGYSDTDVEELVEQVKEKLNLSDKTKIKEKLDNEVSAQFTSYVEERFPVDRVVALLKKFSNRNNDSEIINEVSKSASVPTIYEYVVGIAWYYISKGNFNLYDSLNLTLNADFEPELHAGGGVGDIVINYPNRSIMLEVTLMNKAAQRRGEWEPVLRHSLNNTAENEGKQAITFFIADDLDFNTINIWRAVATVPLKSTSTDKIVNGVIIMPFTNCELATILEKKVSLDSLINSVEDSFNKTEKITDDSWRRSIIGNLQA
jgi:hypothetical protein